MLILSRKKGQSIIIDDEIEVFVIGYEGDQVKIGINAPSQVKIYRKEVLESIRENNKQAVTPPNQMQSIKDLAALATEKLKKKE
ncbi:carbon storage regulator CsrA [Cohnella abietis]|uniref:Translational regulator CsrA n=1 Tax=Cohnella abietis TaxID=2507935 RepID=A0A3T1DDC0_9BACL|nr:carbon storage regulator CsrA [Cohnella abietis]BBI36146.1 carbon storage regulator [Cohnella abietis]